jgi:D-alanine-D-alanine ligase
MESGVKQLTVGVVFGGKSGEHEVSVASAQSVMANIDKSRFKVVPVAITKEGKWLAASQIKYLPSGSLKQVANSEKALEPANLDNLPHQFDVIFPLLHGPFGEDGTIQGFLDLVNVPYVGSGVLGSAVGMDKIVQKQLFKQQGLPVVKFMWFLRNRINEKTIDEIEKSLHYPVFVKPANLGSSVGINKAHNQAELKRFLAEACRYDRKVLVEQGVEKIKEIEVAVLGNDEPQASVCGEIIASNEFYDYNAKYVDGKSETIIPAKIPKDLADQIRQAAIKVFKTLDCAGLGRVDFFVDVKANKFWVNEINTIPGFTQISMYPKLWEASGISYQDLITRLIELALERWGDKQENKISYEVDS